MRKALLSSLLLAFVAISGCTPGNNAPAVSITASASQIDQGKTDALTASVSNDTTNAGVTWAIASGPGALSGQTTTGATYTAPASIASATTVVVAATSVASPTKTSSITITLEPPPQITTTTMPPGTVSVAYTGTVSMTGGVAPYTWALIAAPTGLSLASSTTGTVTVQGKPTVAGPSQTFTVKVTDAQGLSVTSTGLTITVGTLPTVTLNPSNQTVNEGNNATFTATASGTPTPTVQWQVSTNGGTSFTNIVGATSTTLTVTAVTKGMNSNKYRAVFTNIGGSATTTAASLTVNTAPAVTVNPTNQSVGAGGNAIFTAAASGNPTPTVQWQVSTNGGTSFSDIGGATSTTLTVTSVTSGMNSNQYRAVFTNSVNTATTTAATLTVTTAAAVTQNPTNQTVTAGNNATFTAAANGTPTPTVQWQVSTDGGSTFTDIPGATSTTLNLTSVTASQNGNQFQAVFTNTGGKATTTAATLTVNSIPVISQNPSNQTAAAGTDATFNASADGNPTPTVQWQVSTDGGSTFTDVSGATSTTLTLTSVTSGMNGNQYQAVFTNTYGNVKTSAATLTVVTDLCSGAPSGHESVLSGRWVAMLQGWQGVDPGYPAATAFSIDASGTGSFNDVTGGSGVTGDIDSNFGGNSTSASSSTLLTTGSSYKVGLDPTNSSGYIGCMDLAVSGGGTVSMRFALSVTGSSAVRGRIIRWTDTTSTGAGIRGSGLMLPQDASAFTGGTTTNLHSNYAFGMSGWEGTYGHIAFGGRMTVNTATGAITSSTYDYDDDGTVQSNQSFVSASIGSISAETGRGVLTSTPAGSITESQTAMYIVNANEMFLVSMDPYLESGITSGRAIVTGTSFSNTSLSGNYIIQTYGSSVGNPSCNNSGPCADVELGVLKLASGTIDGTSTLEEYQSGSAPSVNNPSGTYSVAASGRVTVSGGKNPPVLYLATPQSNTEPFTGFVVGTDNSATFGQIEAGANSNVSVSALAGNHIFGTVNPGDSTVSNETGVAKVDTSGNVTGYAFNSNTGGLGEGDLAGGGTPPALTITNSPLPGFGNVGSGTVAITDGTRLWFFDAGSSNTSPAKINIVEP
ncbi:MAG TPA: immunoglobulin domain-containing protein [Candidatus Dormibacteraeota bacterium]|nr:immunoglobulin domain-containing protein [Candidatus Dormibacteraeota bacterium]